MTLCVNIIVFNLLNTVKLDELDLEPKLEEAMGVNFLDPSLHWLGPMVLP